MKIDHKTYIARTMICATVVFICNHFLILQASAENAMEATPSHSLPNHQQHLKHIKSHNIPAPASQPANSNAPQQAQPALPQKLDEKEVRPKTGNTQSKTDEIGKLISSNFHQGPKKNAVVMKARKKPGLTKSKTHYSKHQRLNKRNRGSSKPKDSIEDIFSDD